MVNNISRQDRILEAVYCAIDEVNQQLPEEQGIDKAIGTVLIGEPSNLDSQALVSLIVTVEEEIENAFHREISLTDSEDVIFEKNGPLRTIEALVHHLYKLLEE